MNFTSDPLRVVLLTAKMSSAAGGIAVSVPSLAHGLETFSDIETHIMGTLDPNDPHGAKAWGKRVHSFPISGPAPLQRAPRMAPALEQLKPDVVDVQGLWTWVSRVNLQYWRRHRIHYVVTPRGMLDPWARRNSSWKKTIFAAFTETEHLRNAYCLRATAQMEAQHFRDQGLRAPIAIVPNSIRLPDLMTRIPTQRRRVLFLSRLHPKKGLELLLNAWAMLEDVHLEWDLVIAGMDENGYEQTLKNRAQRMHLSRVTFAGPVQGSAKEVLYRGADLFVLPTHAENFGLVVAEALAREVPVITTTNAPWASLEEKMCGWWIPLDEKRLVSTMARAMMLPREELWTMGARGRAWMQTDFSTEDVATKMRNLYFWCAGRGGRPDYVHE